MANKDLNKAKSAKKFLLDEMEEDHIKSWSKGGHSTIENCQMLCSLCNAIRGGQVREGEGYEEGTC